MKTKFVLREEDIARGEHSSRIGRRKKLSRASAAIDTSSRRLFMKHLPTGIEVHGDVPPGHYSNKQMQHKKELLWTELQEQLRLAVAKHLRIPGR